MWRRNILAGYRYFIGLINRIARNLTENSKRAITFLSERFHEMGNQPILLSRKIRTRKTLYRGLGKAILIYYFSLGGYSHAEDSASFRVRSHNTTYANTTAEDVETEIRFGQSVAARVLGRIPLVEDSSLTQYISLVGRSLVVGSSRPELEFHFAVVKSDEINAYSAPGGYIFVTTGALKSMLDESELAAVLAHEIAHVTERHIVKALRIKAADTEKSGLTQIIGSAGDTTRIAFFQTIDKAVAVLFETGFNHLDEKEADRIGTLLLAATGYDPQAMARYLTRIKEKNTGSGAINTTHPPTHERMDTLRRLLADEGLDKLNYPRAAKRFKKYVVNY
ncbi:MAG: M48 family metalloprotease [Gammaproteobacteria bacterium]|nr:M48 family metalloprotease [Gammaproteobacteria bacterium]